jgi:transposase
MKKVIKQVVGIDVAQQELVVCLAKMDEDLSVELCQSHTFANNAKGFTSLLQWVAKHSSKAVLIHYVMEATGVYHEGLAYFLKDKEQPVSIVLPTKISAYIRTLDTKTITDKTAAQAIARFGLERKLETWQKPKPVYKKMRQLTREREQLIAERTGAKNQLHAEQAEAEPSKSSIKRLNERIKLLNRQEVEIKAELDGLVESEAAVSEAVDNMCSIPGVGTLTAITILAETNGFELIRNKRQLSSYAGLDVVEKQSGTSVKAKPRISKRGNKFLRKAMHMAALSAIRHDERYKAVSSRIVGRSAIKMKGAVAVQRKLLELSYTLFKTKTNYDKDYLNPKVTKAAAVQKKEKELAIQLV